jgi:hypothetical protein
LEINKEWESTIEPQPCKVEKWVETFPKIDGILRYYVARLNIMYAKAYQLVAIKE